MSTIKKYPHISTQYRDRKKKKKKSNRLLFKLKYVEMITNEIENEIQKHVEKMKKEKRTSIKSFLFAIAMETSTSGRVLVRLSLPFSPEIVCHRYIQ